MNLQRILILAAALAVVLAASLIGVAAAAFAVFAAVEPWLGAAGGAAVAAVALAMIPLALAWIVSRRAGSRPSAAAQSEPPILDRIILLAKERPLIAMGAAAAGTAAAVAVMVRNPAVVTALVSAFLAGSSTSKPDR